MVDEEVASKESWTVVHIMRYDAACLPIGVG